jgi:hypothetical protein
MSEDHINMALCPENNEPPSAARKQEHIAYPRRPLVETRGGASVYSLVSNDTNEISQSSLEIAKYFAKIGKIYKDDTGIFSWLRP